MPLIFLVISAALGGWVVYDDGSPCCVLLAFITAQRTGQPGEHVSAQLEPGPRGRLGSVPDEA
jgi:hypothetical protein